VHHYNSTQYCKTETVFSIFPSSRPTSHLRWPIMFEWDVKPYYTIPYFQAPLYLQCLCIFYIFCYILHFTFQWADPGGIDPWPGWLTIALQTVGWVSWPVKWSPKWPILVEWDTRPYCSLQRLPLYWFHAPRLQVDNKVLQSTHQPHGTVYHQHYGHQTCQRVPSSGHWRCTCCWPPGATEMSSWFWRRI